MRTTFESLSAGGGFGVEDGGDSRDRWRRESSQYPSATQLHKGHWCQSRRKTTGQAVQTGGSRRTSRCQTDPPRSGLDGGVMGARPACLLHSIAPAKIGRAHGESSQQSARAPGTAAVTDARQEHRAATRGQTQTQRQRAETVAETQAGTISAAAEMHWSDCGDLLLLCTASLLQSAVCPPPGG